MKKKLKTSVSLERDLLEWVDKMVEAKRFASRTHAIEYALQRLRESYEARKNIHELKE